LVQKFISLDNKIINYNTVNIGDTIIIIPYVNKECAIEEESLSLNFLEKIAAMFVKMFPDNKVVVSPVNLNFTIIKKDRGNEL